MRYNYCPKCDKAYVKSRLEKDRCIYCNGPAETVNVGRSGLYYIGYAMTLAGAICVYIPSQVEVAEPLLLRIGGVGIVAVGIAVVLKGSVSMAHAAREKAISDQSEE